MNETYELRHADLDERVVIDSVGMEWTPSPAAGVERKVLESLDTAYERVSTLVRFAPESYFPQHSHGGGEEFIVLEGVFSDETGDFPAGSYVRNPPGTRHKPHTKEGCTIMVKLWQFQDGDEQAVHINTLAEPWRQGLVPGLSVQPLHEHLGISTALVRWDPNTQFQPHTHLGGEEILVLEGTFHDEYGKYPKGSWIRNPRGSRHTPYTQEDGALIYVRVGHVGAQFIEA